MCIALLFIKQIIDIDVAAGHQIANINSTFYIKNIKSEIQNSNTN